MTEPITPAGNTPPAPPANSSRDAAPSLTSKGSFQEDLKDIWKVSGWTGTALTVVSVLALGVPGIVKYFADRLDEAIHFWTSILVTAPLTAAIAVIGVCLIRRWIRGLYGVLVFAAVTVLGASWLATCFSNPGGMDLTALWQEAWRAFQDHPSIATFFLICGGVPLGFLRQGWSAYGAAGYYSALIVGGFLGWAWGAKILPHFGDKRPAPREGLAALALMLGIVALAPVGFSLSPARAKPDPAVVIPALQSESKSSYQRFHLGRPVDKVEVTDLVIDDAKVSYSSKGSPDQGPVTYWPAHATVTITYRQSLGEGGLLVSPKETEKNPVNFNVYESKSGWSISFPSSIRLGEEFPDHR